MTLPFSASFELSNTQLSTKRKIILCHFLCCCRMDLPMDTTALSSIYRLPFWSCCCRMDLPKGCNTTCGLEWRAHFCRCFVQCAFLAWCCWILCSGHPLCWCIVYFCGFHCLLSVFPLFVESMHFFESFDLYHRCSDFNRLTTCSCINPGSATCLVAELLVWCTCFWVFIRFSFIWLCSSSLDCFYKIFLRIAL